LRKSIGSVRTVRKRDLVGTHGQLGLLSLVLPLT
jgi:hypothetical protein